MTKDQIEKLNKELKELSTSFGQLSEKFKEAKGVDTEKENTMYDMMGNIHTRIDRLANSFYEHSYNANIHLPPLTAGQLNKLLKNCGADDSYEVQKRKIYVCT